MKNDTTSIKKSLYDCSLGDLQEYVNASGQPAFRVQQLADWLYKKVEPNVASWANLPSSFREMLVRDFPGEIPQISDVVAGSDGSYKFLLRAADGALIESILMCEEARTTLCVSCMVGCPLRCAFCATGMQVGFIRKLTVAEIIGQYIAILRYARNQHVADRISNVVFMGMGEPLLNKSAVKTVIELLTDERCCGISSSKIAVSTAGVCDGLADFMHETGVRLAISLHFPTDELRSLYMPINKRYSLETLVEELRNIRLKKRDHILIEYMLLRGINDSKAHAHQLVRLVSRLKVKMNLIPYNPTAVFDAEPSSEATVNAFALSLKNKGLTVTVRRSRGLSVEGGCGQFALKKGGSSY